MGRSVLTPLKLTEVERAELTALASRRRTAQATQREIVGPEVIDAGSQTGEDAGDEVEIDVVERARVGVRSEEHLAARVALALRDPRREEENTRERGEIGETLFAR